MGKNKASILIDGVPQAQRIADSLHAEGIRVTVLGRDPLPGHQFLRDADDFAGPLSALARFEVAEDAVFVCSCDLPLFDSKIVTVLSAAIGKKDVAAPLVNGYRQPLCALYRSHAFAKISSVLAQKGACAMRWLDGLESITIGEEQLRESALDPQCAQGANTFEEFERMLAAVNRPT